MESCLYNVEGQIKKKLLLFGTNRIFPRKAQCKNHIKSFLSPILRYWGNPVWKDFIPNR
jgi:hypothetical protein